MERVCDFSRYSAVVQYDLEQYSEATLSFTKYLSCFILSSYLKGSYGMCVYVTVCIVSITHRCNKELLLLLLTAFDLLPKNFNVLMTLT